MQKEEAMKKIYTLKQPISKFEDTSIICNAPRPLIGHDTWEGEFLQGIFYAKISTLEEDFNKYLDINDRLDSREVHYITEELCWKVLDVYCKRNGINLEEHKDVPLHHLMPVFDDEWEHHAAAILDGSYFEGVSQ